MTTRCRYQQVTIPLDGGPGRDHAEALAHDLAERLGLPLELVWVVSEGMAGTDQFELEYQAQLLGPNVTARTMVDDDVYGKLLELTANPDALVCLPSSGRLAWNELVSNSISARLLSEATAPIIAVGPHCRSRLTGSRMAIAIDGTPESETIVEVAIELASMLKLRPFFFAVRADEAYDGSRKPAASSRLTEFDPDAPAIDVVIVEDRPVRRALERLAEDPDVAVIAIASHGADARARLTSPSTAHHLLRHSRCPVLVGHRGHPEDRTTRS